MRASTPPSAECLHAGRDFFIALDKRPHFGACASTTSFKHPCHDMAIQAVTVLVSNRSINACIPAVQIAYITQPPNTDTEVNVYLYNSNIYIKQHSIIIILLL